MDNTDETLDARQLPGLLPLKPSAVIEAIPALKEELEKYNPIKSAAVFGGLLTVPELQCNCLNLEILSHLSISFCAGEKAPNKKYICNSFSQIEKSPYGRYEDPAEDVFVTSIETSRGNFRILEGVWESAGFYLQRFVNIVEAMPARADFNYIRDSVYALLKISDSICERADLVRYQLGNPTPEEILPQEVANNLDKTISIVHFTESELDALGINTDHLSQFLFDINNSDVLLDEEIENSTLVKNPIVKLDDSYYFVLPTATSISIRRYIFDLVRTWDNTKILQSAIADEYRNLLSNTPLLGGMFDAPIVFNKTDNGILSAVTISIDLGIYLNFVFLIDDLDNLECTGFSGFTDNRKGLADDIDEYIDYSYDSLQKKEDYRECLTVIVNCGVGRGICQNINNKERQNWRLVTVSAPDLITLSWTPGFKPLTLRRILVAQEKLESIGVVLRNPNGLVNLIAWVRSLDGDIVPHGDIPNNFIQDGMTSFISIDQTCLRKLRHEVVSILDPHVEQDIKGRWVSVRKEEKSLFEDDQKCPLYIVYEKPENNVFPGVYIGRKGAWWCESNVKSQTSGHFAYERWKLVTVWLSRIVPALEKEIDDVMKHPILWRAVFNGVIGDIDEKNINITFEDVRAEIKVNVDYEENIFTTETGELFEQAHFNAENISERALVDSMIEGVFKLIKVETNYSDRIKLVNSIVRDKNARYAHAFYAQHYLGYVKESLPKSIVKINEIDGATLKLGLGWRNKIVAQEAELKGKSRCTEYLNNLVNVLEDELCEELRLFDRQSIIEKCLLNHEKASVDRFRWSRTSAAVLSLHENKENTLEVLAKNEYELNAVSLTTRLLIEVAICECPLDGKRIPSRSDLSRLMAMAGQIFSYGGWSDAIRWDVMGPELRITALGDIHAQHDFIDNIVSPFSRKANDVHVFDAVENYADNFDDPILRKPTDSVLDEEFHEAWKHEVGVSFYDVKKYIELIEDEGVRKNTAILKLPKSRFLQLSAEMNELTNESIKTILDYFSFTSRSSWRRVPEMYDKKDIQFWRFRRRLTILRKPFIQIDNNDDPHIVVAPGILRDAFKYMFGNFYKGDFPDRQLGVKMKTWGGKVKHKNGSDFSKAVAERLEKIGWQVGCEVKITHLLGQGFELDYGDVDVLAWDHEARRVLIIECKDVHYRKTYGEIAEQLSDFRGSTDSKGKRDNLLRHLDRVDIISKHLDAVAKFIQLPVVHQIESHLVFKNPVPIEFALKHMEKQVKIHIYDEIDVI